MCQEAVDFGKHGVSVNINELEMIRHKIKNMPRVNRDTILKDMQEKIDGLKKYKEYVNLDWRFSIINDYAMEEAILSRTTDAKQVTEWVLLVFDEIVMPMTYAIRHQMIDNCITTEGEFFSCNLRCRITQKVVNKSRKPKRVNEFQINDVDEGNFYENRNQIIENYTKIWKELVLTHAKDSAAIVDLAVALYISSYWSATEEHQAQLLKHGYDPKHQNFK